MCFGDSTTNERDEINESLKGQHDQPSAYWFGVVCVGFFFPSNESRLFVFSAKNKASMEVEMEKNRKSED